MRQQEFRHIAAAHIGGPLQGSHAPGDLGVDVVPSSDQQFREFAIVLLSRPVEKRLIVCAFGVHERGIRA